MGEFAMKRSNVDANAMDELAQRWTSTAGKRPLSLAVRVWAARSFAALGWTGTVGLALLLLSAGAHCGFKYGLSSPGISSVDVKPPRAMVSAAVADAKTPPIEAPDLPLRSDVPRVLKQIRLSLNKAGLNWPQANYRFSSLSSDELALVEVNTTLKGSYAQLRQALAGTMNQVPALAMRELSLSRPSSDTAEVEAKIKWVVFLSDEWPPAVKEGPP
jgi:hypothetical protein